MNDVSARYDRATKLAMAVACILLAFPRTAIDGVACRIAGIPTLLVEYAYSPDSRACVKAALRAPLEHLHQALSVSAIDFHNE